MSRLTSLFRQVSRVRDTVKIRLAAAAHSERNTQRLTCEPLESRAMLSVAPLSNFAGLDFGDGNELQPAPSVAVGADAILHVAGGQLVELDKVAGTKIAQQDLDAFFGRAATGSLYFTGVAYDKGIKRFIVFSSDDNSGSS